MSGNICHLELVAIDTPRAHAFYNTVFGWQFEKAPNVPEDCDYWLFHTPDQNGDGLSGGGMMRQLKTNHGTTPYIHVDTIEEASQKVTQAGGMVIMPKTAVLGKGYFAIFLDTEGSTMGLWECDQTAS